MEKKKVREKGRRGEERGMTVTAVTVSDCYSMTTGRAEWEAAVVPWVPAANMHWPLLVIV